MEQPQPDDKNWTWVLERPCPDCSFDARTIARHAIGATLRTIVGAWQEVLSRGDLVRQRPPRRTVDAAGSFKKLYGIFLAFSQHETFVGKLSSVSVIYGKPTWPKFRPSLTEA
jgi:hypothetical protein